MTTSLLGYLGKPLHYGYVFESQLQDIQDKIDSYVEKAKSAESEEEKKRLEKIINDITVSNMIWYPTVENFTKVVMAHFETLMYMMYQTVSSIQSTKEKTRTLEKLGISSEALADVDMITSKTVPPFPRVAESIQSDGITTKQDVWIGQYRGTEKFLEIELVEGLLNGARKIAKVVEAAIKKSERDAAALAQTDIRQTRTATKFPLTPYDLYMPQNPYAISMDEASNAAAFARTRSTSYVRYFWSKLIDGEEWLY